MRKNAHTHVMHLTTYEHSFLNYEQNKVKIGSSSPY